MRGKITSKINDLDRVWKRWCFVSFLNYVCLRSIVHSCFKITRYLVMCWVKGGTLLVETQLTNYNNVLWNHLTSVNQLLVLLRSLKKPLSGNSAKFPGCWAYSHCVILCANQIPFDFFLLPLLLFAFSHVNFIAAECICCTYELCP